MFGRAAAGPRDEQVQTQILCTWRRTSGGRSEPPHPCTGPALSLQGAAESFWPEAPSPDGYSCCLPPAPSAPGPVPAGSCSCRGGLQAWLGLCPPLPRCRPAGPDSRLLPSTPSPLPKEGGGEGPSRAGVGGLSLGGTARGAPRPSCSTAASPVSTPNRALLVHVTGATRPLRGGHPCPRRGRSARLH